LAEELNLYPVTPSLLRIERSTRLDFLLLKDMYLGILS
jgi:hypothetical protein